jgi:hypothetical protein
MNNWDLVWLTLINELILVFVYMFYLNYFNNDFVMSVFGALGWFFIIIIVGLVLLTVAHSYCDYGEHSLFVTIMINLLLVLAQAWCVGSITQAIFIETLQIWPIILSVLWIVIVVGELEYFVIKEWLN